MHKVRVWDLPTRVFHWLLLLLVVAMVVTAKLGGAAMDWHLRCGYVVFSLLLFRLVWGFVGGVWSRFSSFLYPPGHLLAYVRGQGSPMQTVGHNPLGGLSVLAMLLVLLAQVGSGLFSDDEIATAGPLVQWASGRWVSLATYYHTKIGKVVLLALVALHVGAIGYYRWRKGQNLVLPMVSGDKTLNFEAPSARDGSATRLWALALWGACAVLVALLVRA